MSSWTGTGRAPTRRRRKWRLLAELVAHLAAHGGLFASLAARRTKLAGWKRLLIVAALIGLGALVVLLKTLAH